MKSPYPRMHFIIRFLALSIILAAIIFIVAIPKGVDRVRLAGAGALAFLGIAIITLSPLFTAHEMDDIGLHLRNGLVFNISIRFDEIASVEEVGHKPWTFGLLPSMSRGRVILANGNHNLVAIKLKSRKRFRSLLARSFDEIIIDLVNPVEFVKQANQRLQG